MASSITLPSPQSSVLKSKFLGKSQLHLHPRRSFTFPKQTAVNPSAKFNLSEILGGRGLCNGEEGLQKELTRNLDDPAGPIGKKDQQESISSEGEISEFVPEDGFEKELMGLTGGFPGGEKGLQKFVEENPIPAKESSVGSDSGKIVQFSSSTKPKPPELPLLMPGMIAIVKNENSPYYMYCGIVQRITDGKAGVLFEGGNWDRLITFRLEELERREKGPPMKNPRSAVLEPFLLQSDSA